MKAVCITVLGAGHLRPAPGTWGSAFACAIFTACCWPLAVSAAPRWTIELVLLAGIAASSWASVRWGEWALARYGAKDPREFVLDEFAGQWVALLCLPALAYAGFWQYCVIVGGQFLLFRILDIIKPPPARQMERWPAGVGVLCDDLMSGVYAALLGQAAWRLTPLATMLGLADITETAMGA
ncbi:MAG: phosphatidylglycerophosphatase A [Planctomycetes bacterium]|nr:phosphatidylglycerophosphatase A [Planctomycetota bacterium]